MSPFDYIRRRLTKIADVVLSVDGAYPTWSYSDLCALLDEVEKEWSKECYEDGDTVSRQAAISVLMEILDRPKHAEFLYVDEICKALGALPSAQPEQHEIGYSECANAMLKMWIDNVVTDGEYSRIMDKLNAHWAERREE